MSVPPVRAVLFDFGGTLYGYSTLARAEAASLVELAGWAGVDAEPMAIRRVPERLNLVR